MHSNTFRGWINHKLGTGLGVKQRVGAFGQTGERTACPDRYQTGHFYGPRFILPNGYPHWNKNLLKVKITKWHFQIYLLFSLQMRTNLSEMYISIYTHIYALTHTYVHIYSYSHICVYMYICLCKWKYMNTCRYLSRFFSF